MTIRWLLFEMTWTMMTWIFNVIIKWLYLNMVIDVWLKYDYYVMTWIILTWKIASDYEMTRIWITSWKLTTKWLMYNDIGNVDHLSTYLPTQPPPTYLHTTYLPTHPLTFLPIHPPTYLLPTSYLPSYNLFITSS
jgi:hypothetical protein